MSRAAPHRQVARLSTDRCREIEAALLGAGYLAGKPSTLELQYPHGGCWHLPTDNQQLVIVVSASALDGSEWVVTIEPGAPLRPTVVYRTPPSEARWQAMAQLCFDVALTLHDALRLLCPELRWEVATHTGDVVYVDTPIPPRA